MNKLSFHLALLSLVVIISLVCSFSPAGASVDVSVSGSPTVEMAQVSPENGPWSSTFTYEVIYTDIENNMPAAGYPKVYIDGSPEKMVEKDPADNDVTDGKIYKYDWTTTKENVGYHIFYCYVKTSTGENARDPAIGTYDGPLVKKWSVSLSCTVDNLEPATGEISTFSGHLRTDEENLGVAGKSLILYKLLLDNDVSVGSSTTYENGYFTFQLDVPSSGIFCYKVRFPGDNYYAASESSTLYVNTLDKPLVFGVYIVILLALVGVMMFLFSRGITIVRYFKFILLGFLVGFFLVFLGAGDISFLAAGGIVGYLFAKEAREWTKHLRIGCMTSFIFLLVFGIVTAYFIILSSGVLVVRYSVTQTEVLETLFTGTIFSLIYYVLLVGIGSVLGGLLRKLLKPAEQDSTGSGVGQVAGKT